MEPMDRRTWGRLAAGLLGMPLLGGMAACGGSSNDGATDVRLVNASAGYPSLDFFLDGTLSASSVAYGNVSDYIGTDAAVHTTAFNVAGSSTAVLSQTRSIAKDAPVTLIAYGWAGALKQGSVINFLMDDGQIRFEISLEAAEKRGLKLSSRLIAVSYNLSGKAR